MRLFFYRILTLLDKDIWKMPLMLFLFIFLSMLDFIGLAWVGIYISSIVSTDESASLSSFQDFFGFADFDIITSGVVLFFIFFAKSLAAIFVNYIIIRFSQGQELKLRSYLMRSYQNMKYEEYVKRNSSEYIYSIQQLTATYSGVLKSLLKGFSDLIIALVILLLLGITNVYMLTVVVLVLGISIYLYDYTTHDLLTNLGRKINSASTSMIKGVHEGIEGLKDIRILGRESFFYKKVVNEAKLAVHYHGFQQVLAILPRHVFELLIVGLVVFFVFFVVDSGRELSQLAVEFSIFSAAAIRLIPIANVLSATFSTIRFSKDSIGILHADVQKMQTTYPQERKMLNNVDPSQVGTFEHLTLENVSFDYKSNGKCILNNVSLRINSGDSIGIVGASGSGKTTLIDMLLGLVEPGSGKILFNGVDIRLVSNKWLSQVAYLPQQTFLIDDTLRRNIALGIEDKDIDDELMFESVRKARLEDLVQSLPGGINTKIGERGARLSGGQRQRIALARAFYYRRSVLILDESTSALDSKTEDEIVREIQRFKGLITMLIVTHRPTTISHCDHIFRLHNGKLIEVTDR